MIEWNPATVKPQVNPNDEWDQEHGFSDKVLVKVLDSYGRPSGYSFAKYRHTNDHWIIEGYLVGFAVSHWSSLNEPES